MLQRHVMQEETKPNFLMFMLRSQGEAGRHEATGEISSLIVLEARSLKSGCQQGHAPPETLGGLLPRLSSWWLAILCIPWLAAASHHLYLCCHRCSPCVSTSDPRIRASIILD